MKKAMIVACCGMLVPAILAAPVKKADPVAEGFPAWTGITPKNYIKGRVLLSDAELRQRITVVVEFDADKAAEQLEDMGQLADNIAFSANTWLSPSWETLVLPRDVMVIFVAHNVKTHEAIAEALKGKDGQKFPGIQSIQMNQAPIYENVTFEGAPANEGKFPFAYVMGIEGKEPLAKVSFTTAKATRAAVKKAIDEGKAKITEDALTWRPFYGYVAEPKFFGKDIEKALAKGKPIDTIEAKILRSVTSKDAAKAKEAQMLYDALEQTRSDTIWVVRNCVKGAPHVAAYKLNSLIKCWPKTKKQLADVSEKLKANAGAKPLIMVYAKVAEWSNPDFMCKNAGEAKKIVQELQKMKKVLQPLTSDKDVMVQNGALMLDGMIDELITVIPTRVPQK